VAWVSGSREEARATDRRHLFPATRDEKPKRTEQTLSFFLAFGKRFSYFFLSSSSSSSCQGHRPLNVFHEILPKMNEHGNFCFCTILFETLRAMSLWNLCAW